MKATAPRWEPLALAALCGAWGLVNLLTLGRYPQPWVDEIQFADPAMRWASGQGFTSTVWIAQGASELWAGNAPLYSALLAGWLTLLGSTGLEAVRSFNLILVLAAVGVMWWLVRARGWVTTPAGRVLLVLLLLCGHGITFGVRMGRYDVLGLLLAVLAAVAWSAPRERRRWGAGIALAGVAAFAPAAGLALVPAALVVLSLAVALQGREALPRAIAAVAGLAAGGALLVGWLQWQGVWEAFRASTSAVGVIGHGLADKLAGLPRAYLADKSTVLLAAAALWLWWQGRRGSETDRRGLRFALLLVALLPAALQLAGKFPVYYGWMVFVPLAVAVCGSVQTVVSTPAAKAASQASRWRMPGSTAAVAGVLALAAVGVGLPLRLAGVAAHWQAFDPSLTEQYAQRWLRPDDRLVADFKGHYAARRFAQGSFAPTALQVMQPAERDAVTALWLRPADMPRVAAVLGGRWQEAAPRLAAGSGVSAPWARVVRELAEQDYPLALYRRRSDDVPLAPAGLAEGAVASQFTIR